MATRDRRQNPPRTDRNTDNYRPETIGIRQRNRGNVGNFPPRGNKTPGSKGAEPLTLRSQAKSSPFWTISPPLMTPPASRRSAAQEAGARPGRSGRPFAQPLRGYLSFGMQQGPRSGVIGIQSGPQG